MIEKPPQNMAEPILDWILNGIPKAVNFKLFDDVGFIYEAQLARMEISRWWRDLIEFRKRAAYFEEVEGNKSYHYFISDIKGKDQIGRTNQYLTHWYYPYKAKFHPQMIKALINWMGLKQNQLLLDPFVGSGTALIEGKLLGLKSVGIDIDPLCVLMSNVKTSILDIPPAVLRQIEPRDAFSYFRKLKPHSSLTGLEQFGVTVLGKSPFQQIGEEFLNQVANFYLLSYLYALSDYTYIKRDMWQGFSANTSYILRSLEDFAQLKDKLQFDLGQTWSFHGDSRDLEKLSSENRELENVGIRRGNVDGIITSPPYSIAVDYIKQDLHAFSYLGVNAEQLLDKLVGLRGKHEQRVRLYFEDMEKAFQSMYWALRSKGYCIIIIGDVMFEGSRLPITQKFIEIGRQAGFQLAQIIRRPILGGFARLRYEYVIIFQKS